MIEIKELGGEEGGWWDVIVEEKKEECSKLRLAPRSALWMVGGIRCHVWAAGLARKVDFAFGQSGPCALQRTLTQY